MRPTTPLADSLSLRLPHNGLTQPHTLTRRLILQKARHHTPNRHALTACRHMVSGTLSLPSRGTFHHSLTVLSTIGHQEVFRLDEWSRQIHNTLHGNAATREHHHTHRTSFRLRDSHPLRPGIPTCSTNSHGHADGPADPSNSVPTTPRTQPLPGLPRARFSLFRFRSPLLTESPVFSLPTGTKMFHFPAFPPTPYTFRRW